MNINTCAFVLSSDIIPPDILDAISEHGNLTWGGANRTLVCVECLIHEIKISIFDDEPHALDTIATLEALPEGVYIDLEN